MTSTNTNTSQQALFAALMPIVALGLPPALQTKRQEIVRQTAHLGVYHAAVTKPLPPGYQLVRGKTFDWLLMRAKDCPLYRKSALPIPNDVRNRLQALKVARIDFDELWLAHEVHPGTVSPGDTLQVHHLLPKPAVPVRPDPILFGVNLARNVADLFYLGHWRL